MPAGEYSINVAEAPIIFMKGMSSSIRGAGMYHTTIGTRENSSFFAESAGQWAKYNVILAYRAGGPPTYIEDMCISGPVRIDCAAIPVACTPQAHRQTSSLECSACDCVQM